MNSNTHFGPTRSNGPADNKSYKNTYFFDGKYPSFSDDLPSLDKQPEINSTIKENPYKTNVEIEKDEVVLKPDLSALFKAKGKKHYDGGIKVNLDPNSFIFSDDKSLSFDKKDHDLYEFKKGGSFNKTTNTPADVLKRNIDANHYNKMIANISNVKNDDITKKTSALMLKKYASTLGNIAYLQEEKKGFPQGIPDFSQGTAPVYDTDLKNEIMQQKQYAKYGGKINNPYIKMRDGGLIPQDNPFLRLLAPQTNQTNNTFDPNISNLLGFSQPSIPILANSPNNKFGPPINPYMNSVTPQGRVTPTGKSSYYQQGPGYLETWEKAIPGISKLDNKSAQSAIYDYELKNNPSAISSMWKDAGLTNQGRTMNNLVAMTDKDTNGKPLYTFNNTDLTPDKLAALKDGYVDGMFGYRQLPYTEPDAQNTRPVLAPFVPRTALPQDNTQSPNLTPGNVAGPAQQGKDVNWQFTPWQRVSQGWNALQYAEAKRYDPYRSHDNASYIDPALVNPEQALGDMRSSSNQQINSLNTLNPILRNAQAAGAYSQYLDKEPQVRSQYDNQNVGILNQGREYNNQIKNNETATNMNNDQQYYDQSVVGQQNFDNLKGYLGNNWMNNVLGDVQTDQSLAYNEMTQKNPAYSFDFKTGNLKRNPVNILDVQSSANQGEQQVMESINKIVDPKDKANALIKYYGLKSFGPGAYAVDEPKKKGGMTKSNPYKK